MKTTEEKLDELREVVDSVREFMGELEERIEALEADNGRGR